VKLEWPLTQPAAGSGQGLQDSASTGGETSSREYRRGTRAKGIGGTSILFRWKTDGEKILTKSLYECNTTLMRNR
jgi:hypothetical protein